MIIAYPLPSFLYSTDELYKAFGGESLLLRNVSEDDCGRKVFKWGAYSEPFKINPMIVYIVCFEDDGSKALATPNQIAPLNEWIIK